MSVTGNPVVASEFNAVRSTGVTLIGPGSIGRGYGQTVFAPTTLPIGTVVAPGYLDSLRNDLFNIRAHQIGTAPALAETRVAGNIITATDLVTFKAYADLCDANRFTASDTRMSVMTRGSASRTTSWKVSIESTFTLTFVSSAVSRYFWNAGGQVRITSTRTGGSTSAQNTSWSNLLTGAGTRTYAAATIYALPQSPTYTELFTTVATAPYATNRYTISSRAVGATGASGNAAAFDFRLVWLDPYVDPAPGQPPAPDDLVDGTLSYTVELRYPTGGAALSGGGNWIGYNDTGASGYYRLPTFAATAIAGS
jgi:hypothetical protein